MVNISRLVRCGLLIGSLFFLRDVYAACDVNGCTANSSDPVKRIYLTSISDGRIYIEPPLGRENLGCTLEENNYLVLRSSHPLFKETYSALLSGAVAGKGMYIRIKNGSAGCEIAYVVIHF